MKKKAYIEKTKRQRITSMKAKGVNMKNVYGKYQGRCEQNEIQTS
jgi:hypothetical protein